MADIEVVGWEVDPGSGPGQALPAVLCWAAWKPGVACPNRAAWLVRNPVSSTGPALDTDGYTRRCGLHRDAWAALEPEAQVEYVALEGEAEP